jgi:hypothetical protein
LQRQPLKELILDLDSSVSETYGRRQGMAEQWINEGKNAVKWTTLSCRTFKDNQTRLQLFALAYNLGNFLRRLALPKPLRHWSLTTLREKLIKIGAKVTRHAKCDVPTGRGGSHAELVRCDSSQDRVAGDSAAGCWSDPGVGASN